MPWGRYGVISDFNTENDVVPGRLLPDGNFIREYRNRWDGREGREDWVNRNRSNGQTWFIPQSLPTNNWRLFVTLITVSQRLEEAINALEILELQAILRMALKDLRHARSLAVAEHLVLIDQLGSQISIIMENRSGRSMDLDIRSIIEIQNRLGLVLDKVWAVRSV